MSSSSWIVFKSLLEGTNSPLQSQVGSFLSNDAREKYESVHASKQDLFSHDTSLKMRLEDIHYSWFISFLEPFAENDKELILSALGDTQSEKLRQHFAIKKASPLPLKETAKNYLSSAIYDYLTSDQKEFLPTEFLPDHPLNALLSLSKRQIQTLVDYLGLHDLAMELRHVIKSHQIKKIQKVLNQDEQKHLKSILKQKEPLSFSRLNLDGWNGDGQMLKAILHHRGFNRLAKALFGCHPSLLWHISHKLDTGRTKVLRKFYTDINSDEALKSLTNQILELIPKVSKES